MENRKKVKMKDVEEQNRGKGEKDNRGKGEKDN